MNEIETRVAEQVRDSITASMEWSERSLQSKELKLGPSDIGVCQERVRRQLDGQEQEGGQNWMHAFMGTAIGDFAERALKEANPDVLIQSEFTVSLDVDGRRITLPAHADVIDPPNKAVWDFKAPASFEVKKRQEVASQSYRFQRALYGLGAWQSGMFGDCKMEEIRVGNIYLDRTAGEQMPHVESELLTEELIFEIREWLSGAIYAFLQGEEAMKEPPRQFCEQYCGYFSVCRATDTDVEGVIRDEDQLTAVEMILEAKELESKAKRMKNQAQLTLKDVEGHTDTHSLRWTLVNGGNVSYERQPYLRLSLTRRK